MRDEALDLLREQFALGWPYLKGTVVRGTLPVSEALLRDLVALRPPPRGARVTGLRILPGATVRVDLVVGGGLLSKRLSPEFRLTGVGGLPGDPTVSAEVSRTYALVLGPLLKGAGLPAGLRFDGQRLTIAVRSIVAERWGSEVASLLDFVRRADLRSEDGTLFVDFEVVVD